MTATFRAFRIAAPGATPALVCRPCDPPGPGEVALRIHACGLNFADLLMCDGRYQDTPPAPFTLGMELAGVIEDTGPDVQGLRRGDRVAVFAGQGGLADRGCFPAARCLRIPDAMPFDHAAAFQVAYGTSHLALDRRAGLRAGETLLVLGAAGGVGLTAVEIGARMGARVIACARGADRLAAAQAAGAAHLLDSDSCDLKAEVRALGGADVVYDPVGGPQFDAAMRATNPEGRIISIGFASGSAPQVPANLLLVKNLTVIGHYWGGFLRFAPEALDRSLSTLIGWYESGGLRPQISHRVPLERAAEGLDILRRRAATGKVVVTMA